MHRRIVERHFRACAAPAPVVDVKPSPLANIKVICKDGTGPGTFALACSVLRLRPLEAAEPPPDEILNLTGVAGYDCHDPRYAVYTCYGTLRTSAGLTAPRVDDVVERIDICPVRESDVSAWSGYAERLAGFMRTQTGESAWTSVALLDGTRFRVQRS